ncbi:unnamed protein product [Fraxinus pennsylvanica]|uniref:Pentatricopeptide repeat-containing protein n=1 Tax=Fraxinus pennsylvanica TaxID=56036 RepID=A0AAD1ZZ75_9LAMI|nr:unnamed protein product [Fraxinus pennsylvanica]
MLHGLSSSSKITTQLISSSSRKSIDYALSIFRNLKYPNAFVFNALIRGLCESSCFVSSIQHFRLMMKLNVRPDRLTFPFVLKSITGLNVKWAGDLVYGGILRMGLEYDDFVRVSLVDMYVKVELLGHALKVFYGSTERNKVESVLLWNVIINGCCKNGELKKALELFEVMPQRNIGSWNSMINGLMRNGEERIWVGKELLEAKRIEEENERKRFALSCRKSKRKEPGKKFVKNWRKAERRRMLGLPPVDPAAVKPSAPPPPVEEKKKQEMIMNNRSVHSPSHLLGFGEFNLRMLAAYSRGGLNINSRQAQPVHHPLELQQQQIRANDSGEDDQNTSQ